MALCADALCLVSSPELAPLCLRKLSILNRHIRFVLCDSCPARVLLGFWYRVGETDLASVEFCNASYIGQTGHCKLTRCDQIRILLYPEF